MPTSLATTATPSSADTDTLVPPYDPAAGGDLALGRLAHLSSFNMRLTLSYMMAAWFREAGSLGLKPSEFALLSLVESNPNVSALVIANALNIGLPNVVALVGKLSRDGLLARQPDPLDRRRQLLTLTEAGSQRVKTVGQAVQAADDSITCKLSPRDLLELNQLLADLRT